MRQANFILLLAATSLAAQPADDAVKKELKLFQGKWVAVSAFDGKQLGEDNLKKISMVVDGDKFVIKTGDEVIEGFFKVDPTKKVKTIDVILTKPMDVKLLGIYQMDGDVRKSCFALKGDGRPNGFDKKEGVIIFEWKRAKQ